MKLKAFMLLTLLGLSASSFADNPPAGEPPPDDHKVIAPAPMGMPAGGVAPVLFKAGGIGTIGFVALDLASIGIAYLPMDHMMVAAAISLQYNDNVGTPAAGIFVGPPGHGMVVPGNPDIWESGLLVAVEYMLKDALPFAMGPALAVRTNFAPITPLNLPAFGQWILMPAWDLWYAPWNAGIGIGASIGMTIVLQKGYNPVISFSTPSMRLAYTF